MAWEEINKYRNEIGEEKEIYELWETDYDILTEEIETDLEVAEIYKNKAEIKEKRKIEEMKYKKEDYELIDNFRDKYNQRNIKFIYTDGSRIEENPSVGAGIVIEEEEDAYYASLPKNSSVYTAEVYAINAALRKIEDKLERENKEEEEMIIILSDN